MIIVMDQSARPEDIEAVRKKIEELGFASQIIQGEETILALMIGIVPDFGIIDTFKSMRCVDEVIQVHKPFQQVSRKYKRENTVIEADGLKIGGDEIVVMAGPSSVDRRDELLLAAIAIKEAGAKVLRGGAYKVKTQGDELPALGFEGLKLLSEAREETGLHIITEVRNPKEVEIVDTYADIIQIGALSMYNYELLATVAMTNKPVLLKRGMMASIKEWLLSAEYIIKRGNPKVILCERGIRTFERYTSFTLDLSSIAVLKSMCHLPVVVDPSHGTGNSRYVPAMARAAIAAGADGLLIEVHPNPGAAVDGGHRQMEPHSFTELMRELKKIAKAIGRKI